MNRFSGIASDLKNTPDRRIWGACEGNQRRADKAFLQAWRLEKLIPSCGTGKQRKTNLASKKRKAMEFRLRDRRLYTTLRFEAFWRVSFGHDMDPPKVSTMLRSAATCASLALTKRVAQCYTFVSTAQWNGGLDFRLQVTCHSFYWSSWKGFEPERLAVVWAQEHPRTIKLLMWL